MIEKIKKRLSKFVTKLKELGSRVNKHQIRTGTKIVELIYFILILWYVANSENKTPNSMGLFLCIAIIVGICMGYIMEKCLFNIFDIEDDSEDTYETEDAYEEEYIYKYKKDNDEEDKQDD